MTPAELVLHLNTRGVKLWTEGEKLRYKAPAGVLTPDLLAELAGNKAEILALLRAAQDLLRAAAPSIETAPRRQALLRERERQRRFAEDAAGARADALTAALRLTGSLDRAALGRALDAMRRRHEPLRTTFAVRDGRPAQTGGPIKAAALPLIDLASLPEARRDPAALALSEAARSRPFDLARGPLFRIALLRLAPREHMLILALHPIIADEASLDLLIDELNAQYDADVGGRLIVFPVLPIQYADYAAWQAGWLRGAEMEAQLSYWRGQLAGAPAESPLPPDRPRPAQDSAADAALPFALPRPLSEALIGLSRQADATLFAVLLAAFAALIYRRSGQNDIVITTPSANRAGPDLDGLIGPLANTLALRLRLDGQMPYRDLLAHASEVVQAAEARQQLPFELLAARLASPLARVGFALRRVAQLASDAPDLRRALLPMPGATSAHDLMLRLSQDADGLRGAFEYRSTLFEPQTIARLSGDFHALLERIAADSQFRLDI